MDAGLHAVMHGDFRTRHDIQAGGRLSSERPPGSGEEVSKMQKICLNCQRNKIWGKKVDLVLET